MPAAYLPVVKLLRMRAAGGEARIQARGRVHPPQISGKKNKTEQEIITVAQQDAILCGVKADMECCRAGAAAIIYSSLMAQIRQICYICALITGSVRYDIPTDWRLQQQLGALRSGRCDVCEEARWAGAISPSAHVKYDRGCRELPALNGPLMRDMPAHVDMRVPIRFYR